jgi:hypothetical protein
LKHQRLQLKVCLILALFAGFERSLYAQLFDEQKTTNVGLIRLGITNYGVIGNGFRFFPQIPSCEYPTGSQIEHLFNAGLWVGAIQGGISKVSTAAVVQTGTSTGNPNTAGYEFTDATARGLIQRSSLIESPFFNPSAISHQDFIADFTDSILIRPGATGAIPQHNPLRIAVHAEHYAWNFEFANFFVILNYTIVNRSDDSLVLPHIGIFQNSIVRNTRLVAPQGTAFFNRAAGGYLDSLDATYKFDLAGEPSETQSYYSTKFLGAEYKGRLFRPGLVEGFRANFQAWAFATDPFVPAPPSDDFDRFNRMRTRLFDSPDSASIRQALRTQPGNRLELLSVGPFPTLMPGDTITISFAAVVARNASTVADYVDDKPQARATLFSNLDLAQRTFNGNDRNGNGILEPEEDLNGDGIIRRFLLPSPPNAPRYKVVPEDRKVILYWDKSAEASVDLLSGVRDFEGYRIYRTNPGDDRRRDGLAFSLRLVAQYDQPNNGIGFDNGFDAIKLSTPVTFDGDTTQYFYKYEFNNLLNGWQYAFNVTAFDSGNTAIGLESLESARSTNFTTAIPGKTPTERKEDAIGIYPNPFYVRAAWSGPSRREQKIYFTNLPPECEITIFTVAGDVIDRFTHNAKTYAGGENRWNDLYGNQSNRRAFSGGEVAWDIFSKSDQALSTGLYIVAVKNLRTGDVKTGRFAVVR